ncbi:hypothetical protein LJC05_04460, partial [Bacteroides sp. OttesenSCG-928-J23]|nr:hypothetical protein [Bacteroides sp. OttesenSCG-928-J23]
EEAVFLGIHLFDRYRRGELDGTEARQLAPGREEFAAVYRYLKKSGGYPFGETELFYRVSGGVKGYGRLLVILEALEELGLVRREGGRLLVVEGAPKADIADAPVMRKLQSGNLVNSGV